MEIESEAETRLIEQVIAGEHQLFHQLIQPYERRLYLTAFSVLRNEADAEDAVQEAVFKAYINLRQFRSDARFSTWLTSITLNEARSRLRKAKGVQIESLDLPPEEQTISPAVLVDWREVPSEALDRMEVRQMLVDAVAELPEIYRVVFAARDLEGLDVMETAQALSITVASVKVRLHRARMMLQKRLAPLLKTTVRAPRRFPWF
jgi:RNA polymerase sigma-70 factor, ECF subfamily